MSHCKLTPKGGENCRRLHKEGEGRVRRMERKGRGQEGEDDGKEGRRQESEGDGKERKETGG